MSSPQTVKIKSNETVTLEFRNQPMGGLLIRKLDSVTLEPLAGVKFQISASDGTVIGPDNGIYTTDSRGTIHIPNLTPGTFIVKEIQTLDGYILDAVAQSIEIKDNGLYTLEFLNVPKGGLTITKLDNKTKAPLAGAIFEVRDGRGAPVGGSNGQYTTDASGTINLPNLPPSVYTVKEIQAPDGYVLNGTQQTVHLAGGKNESLSFYNEAKGGLFIKKLDSVTLKPLAGVKFEVTTSDGAKVGPANGTYVTDSAGTILIPDLAPATYVVREIQTLEGYVLDDIAQTIAIKDSSLYTLEFRNAPMSGLLVKKLDSITHEPIAGVVFKITTSSGQVVGSANGEFTTNSAGVIQLPTLAPGSYTVQEIRAKPGYLLDDVAKTIEIKDKGVYTLEFLNTPEGGLKIVKLDADTRAPIKGVSFEVRKMNGELLGTYRTSSSGIIALPELSSGWYTVLEKQAAPGYRADPEPHDIEVKDGKTAVLELTNRKASSLLIHKIDADTGEGIYGAVFLIYDGGHNPITQVTTDQSGYAYVDEELTAGKYFIKELEAEGYEVEVETKTVYIRPGETSEVTWENSSEKGQIQVLKYSADYNPVTGAPAGSALRGAVFEITRARSGAVVGHITTDARGVAASPPLPLGRYFVREVTAPPYYQLSGEKLEAELECVGQIIKLSVFDKSAALGVTIKKVGNMEVVVGDVMRYNFSGIANTSNVPLENFYWTDRLPTDAVRGNTLVTGTYSQRLTYRVIYKTNSGEWRTLKENLLSTNNYSFSLTPSVLGLMSGEYVTDVRLEFGTVAAGFTTVTKPILTVNTLPTLPSGYQIVNRCEVGGLYQAAWQTANASWITKAVKFGPTPTLPKTGY